MRPEPTKGIPGFSRGEEVKDRPVCQFFQFPPAKGLARVIAPLREASSNLEGRRFQYGSGAPSVVLQPLEQSGLLRLELFRGYHASVAQLPEFA